VEKSRAYLVSSPSYTSADEGFFVSKHPRFFYSNGFLVLVIVIQLVFISTSLYFSRVV
jgi:hypothetical protein